MHARGLPAGLTVPNASDIVAARLEQACSLVPDDCRDLASHLVLAGRDEAAVQALQRAFEGARDAADTGSANGLETIGLLSEWRGEWQQAEGWFRQVETRYGQSHSRAAFYFRMARAGRPGYESKFRTSIRSAFSGGLEPLDAAQLPALPRDGVCLLTAGPDAVLTGLESGDVVVGLDGWRVHGLDQYLYVVSLDWRPDLALHVWRKGRYLDVRVHAMNRYLPFDLGT